MKEIYYNFGRSYKYNVADLNYKEDIAGSGIPWLTIAFLVALSAVFALEWHVAAAAGMPGSEPSIGLLVAMGGLSRNLLLLGEAHRLLSAPFLHANLAHLLGNLLTFAFAGVLLERQVGRVWTFCIFATGALAGSMMSVAVSAPATVTVGASGAIMAMLAALFLITFRLPASKAKTRNQYRVLFLLVPALIPFSLGPGSLHIDYGCHLGGTLLGFVLGALLLSTWPERKNRPALRVGAALLAFVALLSFGGAFYGVARGFPAYEPLAHLIPDTRFPKNPVDIKANAFRLLDAYPRDPRAHLLAAEADLFGRNALAADAELRTALTVLSAKHLILYPSLENVIRGVLAQTVLLEGRRGEARAIAAAACHAQGDYQAPPAMMALLNKADLC